MTNHQETIEEGISSAESLRRYLKKGSAVKVRAKEEISLVKATAFAWFNNHRTHIIGTLGEDTIKDIDDLYRQMLASSERGGKRADYLRKLTTVKNLLVALRSQHIERLVPATKVTQTLDTPPNFSPLISDLAMQKILNRRWTECAMCVQNGASLAATVMMGGLLEALLLTRILREQDKAPIFKTKSAPKDKSGKTKPLTEWMLKDYIDVTHEMNWISPSAKSVGEVLRDYRNYIHPQKEHSHGITLEKKDAEVFWEISKTISRQIIESV